ncbi:VOC family protein [Aestuariispira ectoiniformans]|uniref:VOC family protein n=1 Tax=Aestuariispira ectoiniformans TaxID=2775080 RepID=UPI00223BA82B|nr:VOC family protein [Aestuariispira ectoiniformans]
MHKSRLGSFIIDCKSQDLDEAARFWGQALGYEVKRHPGDDRYAELKTASGEPTMEVQIVNHDSRIHLDIETDDIAAEVSRLEKLGAKRIEDFPRWVVMEAPTGQRFCVVNPQRADFEENAKTWKA